MVFGPTAMMDTVGVWLTDPGYEGFLTSLRNDYNETACEQDKSGVGSFEVFAATTGTVIFLTNLIVVGVILSGGRKLHKPTFYCICNLAVADMLAGLLLLWIFVLQRVALPFRTATSELVQKTFWAVTVWSSMLSQLVIAVDRYCCVTKSYGANSRPKGFTWGKHTRKRWIKVGLALTWLMPILTFMVPVATNWNCLSGCACFVEKNSTSHVYYMICSPLDHCSLTNPPFTKGSMLYLGLSLLFMPTMPAILYAKVFHFVHTSTKKLNLNHNQPSSASNNNHSCTENESRAQINVSAPDSHMCSSGHMVNNDMSISSTPSSDDKQNAVPTTSCQQLTPNKKKKQENPWRRRILLTRICGFSKKAAQNQNDTNTTQKQRKSLLSSNGMFVKFLKSKQRDLKLLRTLVIILALLLISTIPLGILFVASYTETNKRFMFSAKVLLTTSLINSMLNPWIYFWRFPQMRVAIKKLFCPNRPRHFDSFRRNRRESAQTRRHGEERENYISGAAAQSNHRLNTTGNSRRHNLQMVSSSSNSAL